jgi:hypothetical protein
MFAKQRSALRSCSLHLAHSFKHGSMPMHPYVHVALPEGGPLLQFVAADVASTPAIG